MAEQTKAETLAEALPREQQRNRELLAQYEALPNGAGFFAIAMIKAELTAAEKAAASGDVVAMLRAYEALSTNE